jgi:hypothetical protein
MLRLLVPKAYTLAIISAHRSAVSPRRVQRRNSTESAVIKVAESFSSRGIQADVAGIPPITGMT